MKFQRFAVICLNFAILSSAQAAYRAHYRIEGDGAKVLTDAVRVPGHAEQKLLRSLPYFIGHGPEDLGLRYEEWSTPMRQPLRMCADSPRRFY